MQCGWAKWRRIKVSRNPGSDRANTDSDGAIKVQVDPIVVSVGRVFDWSVFAHAAAIALCPDGKFVCLSTFSGPHSSSFPLNTLLVQILTLSLPLPPHSPRFPSFSCRVRPGLRTRIPTRPRNWRSTTPSDRRGGHRGLPMPRLLGQLRRAGPRTFCKSLWEVTLEATGLGKGREQEGWRRRWAAHIVCCDIHLCSIGRRALVLRRGSERVTERGPGAKTKVHILEVIQDGMFLTSGLAPRACITASRASVWRKKRMWRQSGTVRATGGHDMIPHRC